MPEDDRSKEHRQNKEEGTIEIGWSRRKDAVCLVIHTKSAPEAAVRPTPRTQCRDVACSTSTN